MKRILCLLTTFACSLPVLVSNDAAASQNQTDQNKPTKKVTQAAEAPESGDRYVYKTIDGIDLPLYVFQPNKTQECARKPAIVFFFGGGSTFNAASLSRSLMFG